MTPEQIRKLDELYQWMTEKNKQQISLPLDEASKNILPLAKVTGTGSYSTQSIGLSGNAESINVPAQPSGTVLIEIDGISYELLKK